MAGDWKWYDEDSKASTVIPQVQAVAMYTNPRGEIVIRQQAHMMGEDDSVIVIPRTAVATLTKALRAEVAKPFLPEEPEDS